MNVFLYSEGGEEYASYSQEYVDDLKEEITRLNNIIDEFESFLFKELQTYGGGGMVQEYYDKLKELKEGGK